MECRSFAYLFFVCDIALLTLYLPRAFGATEDWGNFTSVISNAKQNTGEYNELISLLANASYLSYTSTIGSSYWHPQDQNASIGEGWTRESFKADPAGGGERELIKKFIYTIKEIYMYINHCGLFWDCMPCACLILFTRNLSLKVCGRCCSRTIKVVAHWSFSGEQT